MLDTKVVTWALALFSAATFVVCILYGLVVPEPLHMTPFLETVLPGFAWLTPAGFLIGLGESFIYGAYAGLVFTPIHNAVLRRARRSHPSTSSKRPVSHARRHEGSTWSGRLRGGP